MAAQGPVQSLQDELSCSICLEYFKDPVSIPCGHNFCRACISQYWKETEANFFCPQCREAAQQRNFRPNRELANIVEIAKRLSLQTTAVAGCEKVTETHREELKLLCEKDQEPICAICREPHTHQAHTALCKEEAAKKYKQFIQAELQTLREEREKLQGFQTMGERKTQEYLEKIKVERQKTVSEFHQLHQFLEKQEQHLLAWLEEVERDIAETEKKNTTRLSEEISLLSDLIREMEEKCQQPASDLLQDAKSSMYRWEKGTFQKLVEVSPEAKRKFGDLCQKNVVLKNTLKAFKESLLLELEKEWVNVTLDPNTVHPCLVLSEDRKCVKWGEKYHQLPNNSKRFDAELCVLGCEGFTSGRHCWEVEVGGGTGWGVGVARESVRRKGEYFFSPQEGIWAVGLWKHEYLVITSPSTHLSLSQVPRRIQISLYYERDQVEFFDAETKAQIFTFSPTYFKGEKIYPWFWVEKGSQLSLCP
ncbi:E3 ubiquitin-protein ligase TRIM39-like [Alligator sinensis]|uniref:E3 ubiquitin-protein ligase TRIM39-like n=1 Tax=Alligator sinensis TaxID=38654 RepID=A0A1U8DYL4_ALLSI|nr:E3 ubiquitin-protein ligase TRIM39-like [Alligator sinensis]